MPTIRLLTRGSWGSVWSTAGAWVSKWAGGLLHIHMEVEVVVFLVYSFIIYHLSLGRKSYLNRNKSCVPKTKFNIIKIKSMEINKKSLY
jgi:hypothetical protein